MLRYFCLLILLIVCIKWSFCYDYMNEEDFRLKKLRKDVRRQRRQRVDDSPYNKRRQNYDEALAQIDVASFIQKPDLEADNGKFANARNPSRKHSKTNSKSINYRSLVEHHMNNAQKKLKSGPNVPMNANPLNVNIDSYNGMIKHNPDPENEPVELNMIHKQQKKCPLKDLKFPFFSHKKAATPKPRKNKKKRKLFSFQNCMKNSAVKSTPQPNVKLADKALYNSLKIRKRSFGERKCPLCKRMFAENDDINAEVKTNKIIHNSRQYFKELSEMGKSKTNADNLNVTNEDSGICDNSIGIELEYFDERNKRDIDQEKERQLKELDEVQKKIDNLDLQFQKLPKGQNDNVDSR